MKELISKEFEIGSDAKGKALVGIENANLVAEVNVTYPIAKIIEPVTKAVDSALDKLEDLIPGDWDKAIIEKIKEEYKEKLIELLAEGA